MKLLDGEHKVFESGNSEIVLTNMRVCQKISSGTNDYNKQIFLKHVTGCELIRKGFAFWLILAVLSFVFLSFISFHDQAPQVMLFGFIVSAAFVGLYYWTKYRILMISSPSIKITQKISMPDDVIHQFMDKLQDLASQQNKVTA